MRSVGLRSLQLPLRIALVALAVTVIAIRAAVGPDGSERIWDVATGASLFAALFFFGRVDGPRVTRTVSEIRDAVTSLFSRSAFDELALDALERGARNGGCSSILFIQSPLERSTDRTARTIAGAIRATVRPHDIASRYSDTSYVVLLDRCQRDEAKQVASRILRAIAASTEPVAVACGIAVAPEDGSDLAGLIQAARKQMRAPRLVDLRVAATA